MNKKILLIGGGVVGLALIVLVVAATAFGGGLLGGSLRTGYYVTIVAGSAPLVLIGLGVAARALFGSRRSRPARLPASR